MDKIEVTQADIDAWEIYGPKIFHCEMTGPEALASHRLSHTPQSVEPVAWMYSKNGKVRTEHSPAPCQDMIDAGWKADPLYPDPPATHVAALVEAAYREGWDDGHNTSESDTQDQWWKISKSRQALAPFTKGQP